MFYQWILRVDFSISQKRIFASHNYNQLKNRLILAVSLILVITKNDINMSSPVHSHNFHLSFSSKKFEGTAIFQGLLAAQWKTIEWIGACTIRSEKNIDIRRI